MALSEAAPEDEDEEVDVDEREGDEGTVSTREVDMARVLASRKECRSGRECSR